MLVGVFSDVHDNLDALGRALALFAERGVVAALFLGDFCSPLPVHTMGREFGGVIHCIFGNGDGDRFTIGRIAQEKYANLRVHGEHAQITIGGLHVAMTHYPLYGNALARTGDYAAVFSGHTHQASSERIGGCLWLNPGELMGAEGQPTCAIFDTSSVTAEITGV